MGLAHQWRFILGSAFTGGPNVELNSLYQLALDGIELEVEIPASNIIAEDMSQQISFPFRSPDWLAKHQRHSGNHLYLSLLARNWAYLGPYWKVRNEPLGVLSVSFRIKRAPLGCTLSVEHLPSLEAAIHRDYEEYFEAEEPGEFGRGSNAQLRREAEKMFTKSYETSRDLNAEKARYLKTWLCEVPEHFGRKQYGDQSWVTYRIEREPNYPCSHYCYPLDAEYYLDIVFTYGIDFRQYFHIWKDHAEAAEQRIMSSVQLKFPARHPSASGEHT